MRAIGISLGTSTIKAVELEGTTQIKRVVIRAHEGDPRAVFAQIVNGFGIDSSCAVAVTGRALRHHVNLTSISEPLALEMAFGFVNHKNQTFEALVSVGGENFILYTLNREGRISNLHTGNKCASGTGEFFLQQIRRMNLGVEEALRLAHQAPPREVSGRCSVFAKSDCTHALNRGEPMAEVVAGLCQMMARKISELLAKVSPNRVIVTGGVAQNGVVMDFLRQEVKEIFIPEEAVFFEALGAALFAAGNKTSAINGQRLFKGHRNSFEFLPPLAQSQGLVEFKSMKRAAIDPEAEYILGLDVGSTTTKAVIVRFTDLALVASVYLRTNGDPVGASRNCYKELLRQVPEDIQIIGLATTGSGRQIAGLVAKTNSVINEIIAHASASTYFDKGVDTIFEIGGQDAKYTHLSGGVACDYAMNEACSAGTGSFLEESAQEALGVRMEEIAQHAMASQASPNFNDQCAAFISSDVKTASQEGIDKKDIIAGLVYSICMNYNNRVKGNRPVGERVFMQGGVCYNQAIPLAMAQLVNKKIIVPPEPGLMGAFGCAIEVRSRIEIGLLRKEKFDLKRLAQREVTYRQPFTCKASRDCDRNCRIELIEMEGETRPFGGACNRYYNLRLGFENNRSGLNLVDYRERLLFKDYTHGDGSGRKRIGLNRSFLLHSLFPLYYHFFRNLGLEVVLPEKILSEGIQRQRTAFCFPAEISHGFFAGLLRQNLDYIFLPQIVELPLEDGVSRNRERQNTCHLLQAEPYYLKAAFQDIKARVKIISRAFNLSDGYDSAMPQFTELGRDFGLRDHQVREAYRVAVERQREFENALKLKGKEFLRDIELNPERFAVALFGHPYNGFCSDANMAIPQKFASRGIDIIPFDMFPFEDASIEQGRDFLTRDMTWVFGRMIIGGACLVKDHPQLFGAYITNFSCGPDSFLLGYFRTIMAEKPSLTLELDSHTQDVGLDTRIEAFLEIIKRYRQLNKRKTLFRIKMGFSPAKVIAGKDGARFVSSSGREFSLRDPRVNLLIPPMGSLGSEAIAAVFTRLRIDTRVLPTPDMETLKLGRMYATTKECLPLHLVTGSLLRYLQDQRQEDEQLVYFMPTTGGSCRFSQYNVFLKDLIKKREIEDVAVLSLTTDNSYMGFGPKFTLPCLKAVIIADVMDDINNALLVLAKDKEEAGYIFHREWQAIIDNLKGRENLTIENRLKRSAEVLRQIPLNYTLAEARIVALHGEIYVRKELFSRGPVIETLRSYEIVVKTAPMLEWLYYVDYLRKKGIIKSDVNQWCSLESLVKRVIQPTYEYRIKGILAKSGLYQRESNRVDELIERWGKDFVDVALTGEPILTISAALKEVGHTISGLISIGPFACLPTRTTESILSSYMADGRPFLSVETDGNPFPPVIEARLETFCLQVARLHNQMKCNSSAHHRSTEKNSGSL